MEATNPPRLPRRPRRRWPVGVAVTLGAIVGAGALTSASAPPDAPTASTVAPTAEAVIDTAAPDGPTEVAELRSGEIKRYKLSPRDFGLEEHPSSDLSGGDAAQNAQAARDLLSGKLQGAARACVIMTAAGALYAAGRTGLRDGARLAASLIDDGSAARILTRLTTESNRP